MTIKIERDSDSRITMIHLIGRVEAHSVEAVRREISASEGAPVVLDLDEVTVVDVHVVRFLNACEAQGLALRRCPLYVRQWMSRESW
jgi:anti-anti-sigma regulatory factor